MKNRRGGFTLIELLVTIAIIGLLLGLLLGGLRLARDQGRRAVSLSNLKTHAQVFAIYTGDYSGYFPYFTAVGAFNNTLEGGGIILEGISYFDANSTWHIFLADDYYTGSVEAGVFFPPNYVEGGGGNWPIMTPYNYGCVFIASSRYWNPYTRMGPSQYQGMRTDSVLYPSSKVLILESWPLTRDIQDAPDKLAVPLPSALCDGSAQLARPIDYRPGYKKADGWWKFRDYGAVHSNDWPPFLHTIDGVRGRDLR